ncbi:protein translocase subunit SecF [Candidatus Woesearchaeota archaeon]|jgi:preprotein translocase subunit SecF|nr:protein translocase subunit SecF [Candidatus Woesearchaeota archaeon]MBT6519472.1 protein translocase subunit SecF [Candidatus Woesearchaeota archaeon]MBT7368220.1 protein translocase subunit SecF [Candidatus Woesearchaeota archaeon]
MVSRRERKLLRQKGARYVKGETNTGLVTSDDSSKLADSKGASGKLKGTLKGKVTGKVNGKSQYTHSAHSVKSESKFINKILHIYEYQYKKLFLIPVIMLVLAFIIIGANFAITGEFVNKGVSLKGGVTVTVPFNEQFDSVSNDLLEKELLNLLPGSDVAVRSLSEAGNQIGIIIDASDVDTNSLVNTIKLHLNLEQQDYTVETIGSSLGQSFFREILTALLLAFIFMGLVVFIYFRTAVPSLAVILAAFSDMIITLAIIDLIGIKLSTAGIAAFLMLIGYSVDTDILLTTRVIKRKEGSVFDRVIGAAKTGLTMNLTTLSALTIAFIFTPSEVLKQIMLILIIGLLVDIINTWLQNAAILRYYIEKKGDRQD